MVQLHIKGTSFTVLTKLYIPSILNTDKELWEDKNGLVSGRLGFRSSNPQVFLRIKCNNLDYKSRFVKSI